MQTDLTRPITGIENRTAQEVFDIMCDRIRSRLSASIPAELDAVEMDMIQRGDMLGAALGAKVASALLSLSARVGELEKALEDARKTMRNARGAIESNQIDDKDVRRQLTTGIERIDATRAALSKGGNGNG